MNLKLIAPVRVVIDDTGGPFTGWPSIVAKDSADMTLIHRAGFKQEHWSELTQVQAVQLANEIVKAINLYAGEGEAVAAVKTPMYKYVFKDGGGDIEIKFVTPTVHEWVTGPVNIPPGDTSITEDLPEECREAVELQFDEENVEDAMKCETTIGSSHNDRAICARCLLNRRVILEVFSEKEARELVEDHNIEIIDTVHWVMY
jgi:hypothetical protein